MLKRRFSRRRAVNIGAQSRNPTRRPSRSSSAEPEAQEVPPQVRAPNRTDRTGPLNEEELAALKAGWGFVE